MQTQTLTTQSVLSFLSKNSRPEIRQLLLEDVVYLILVYIHFGLCLAGYLPFWTFCVGAPMYVSRWMIGLHETLHQVKIEDTPLFIKLHLLILTPVSLGYREIRDIHMRHHAYTLTAKDPDLYHIRGNIFAAYLGATFSPEFSAFYWLRDNGADMQLIVGILIRFILFVLFVWALGWVSLWYFIPVRLAYGSCMFSISHFLHHKVGQYGTFTPHLGEFLDAVIRIYFGRAALHTLCYHDIHHDYPRIAAAKLPEARLHYTPKLSSLVNTPRASIPIAG